MKSKVDVVPMLRTDWGRKMRELREEISRIVARHEGKCVKKWHARDADGRVFWFRGVFARDDWVFEDERRRAIVPSFDESESATEWDGDAK